MIYNIYSIYNADIEETADLFLSANDITAKKTFIEHLRKLKENSPYLDTNNLLLINLGEYNTKTVINKGVANGIDSIENAINGAEPYFLDIALKKVPERMKKQIEQQNNNYMYNLLEKIKTKGENK